MIKANPLKTTALTLALATAAVTLTAAVALAPVGPAHAQTSDLVPLEKFLADHQGHGDWVAMGYVAERCSAFYYDYALNLEDETDPQMKMASKASMSQAQIFNQFAVNFNSQGTTTNKATIAETTNKYITDLGKLYAERIRKQRLLTGNAFDDSLLSGDMKVCAKIAHGGS